MLSEEEWEEIAEQIERINRMLDKIAEVVSNIRQTASIFLNDFLDFVFGVEELASSIPLGEEQEVILELDNGETWLIMMQLHKGEFARRRIPWASQIKFAAGVSGERLTLAGGAVDSNGAIFNTGVPAKDYSEALLAIKKALTERKEEVTEDAEAGLN